jgi:hypothetical protein
MRVTCPECGKEGTVPQSSAGQMIQCPVCDERYRAEASAAPVAASATQFSTGLVVGLVVGAFFLGAAAGGGAVAVLTASRSEPQARTQPQSNSPAADAPVSLAVAEEARPQEVVSVSANELFKAFAKDLAGADVKYLNKPVLISGVTGKVEKDNTGRYFIAACPRARTVASNRISGPGVGYHIPASAPGVMIYFRPDAVAALAGRGQKEMAVRGICRGSRPDKNTSPELYVVVEEAGVAE